MRGTWIRIALAAALPFAAFVLAGTAGAAGDAEEEEIRVVVENEDGEEEESSYLGVSLREETDHPEGGARIEAVLPDSPAEKSGLLEGDVVVAFRGVPIRGPASLTKQIRASKPGDRVPLTVVRAGKRETVTVEIGERRQRRVQILLPGGEEKDILIPLPDTEQLQLEIQRAQRDQADALREIERIRVVPRIGRARGGGILFWSGKPKLGVELVQVTPDLREFLGGRRDAGVLVGKVLSGSAAERAGMKVGDLIVSVDDKEVGDHSDLLDALDEKDGETVDLGVVRDKKTLHLKATIPEVEEEEEPSGPRASSRKAPAPPELPALPALPPLVPAPPACTI